MRNTRPDSPGVRQGNKFITHWMTSRRSVAGMLFILGFLVGGAAVVLFQSGVYKQVLASEYGTWAPLLYYSFWLLCAIATAATVLHLVVNPVLLVRLAPLYISIIAIVSLTLMHYPIGSAGKSLIVSCALIVIIVTVVPLSSACVWTMRIAAWGVAFTAVSFIVEMHLPGLFSNVSGRSAGLFENPNIAGHALVLGGTASLPFVARKWSGAFAVLIVIGAIATISRTTLLVLFVAVVSFMVIELLVKRKKLDIDRAFIIRTIAVAVVGSTAIIAALQNNSAVSTYFYSSASTSLTALSAAGDARSSRDDDARSSRDDDARSSRYVELTATELSDALGATNSGAARLILMENALHQITLWGVGADGAHDIAPHNQFLFFAVAFGVLGIISVIFLVGSIIYLSRSNVLFCLATTGMLMFTHDLTMLDLATPIALGCAGAIYLGARESIAAEQARSPFLNTSS